MTTEVLPTETSPSSTWDASQISTLLFSLLPDLPPIAKIIIIVSTSIVPLPVPATSSMSLEGDAKVDTFAEELLQYATKDFSLSWSIV